MRRVLMAVLATVAAASIAAVGALAASTADSTGVTKKSITLGGTYPLSGPASSYAPIPVGLKVYFSYVNARKGPDGKRGVDGRQIIWKYLDDGYNPAQTVQQTRALVESDKVFALVGGLGTEPQTAVEPYLNKQQVPQLFVSTGATEFGDQQAKYPWTIGWQPDYQAEGAIYGKAIVKSSPNAKIGIIYQDDAYGLDYIEGLEAGLGGKKSNIVMKQGVQVTSTSVAAQIAALKAAKPDILCIFETPALTIATYATMKALDFKPGTVYLNSVSATDTFMKLAVAKSSPATVNGSLSVGYVLDPQNPKYAKSAGIQLYKKLMAKYAPKANASDGLYIYGVAKAYDTVQLLYKAGKNPTRKALMNAARHMNWTNPFLLPGIKVKTTPKDPYPISQMQEIRFESGLWHEVGPLVNGRGK